MLIDEDLEKRQNNSFIFEILNNNLSNTLLS